MKQRLKSWVRSGFAHRKIGLVECLEERRLLTADWVGLEHCLADPADDSHENARALRYDSTGAYYFEAAPPPAPVDTVELTEDASQPRVAIREVPVFHSSPSSKQKIFLDFNGHRVAGTGWNDNNDGRLIEAPAYDIDGNEQTFGANEQRFIERIWARVAEDFSPFDIDVTTESPPSSAFRRGSEAIRVMISSNVDQRTGNRWFDNSGGVAYIGSWRWKTDTPVWVFENNLHGSEKRIAEAVSHEVGHAFGLDHDGFADEEYFQGFGDGATGWAPLMGAGYDKSLTQWSRGEYNDATNREDDLQVITSRSNGVRYVADDHAAIFAQATRLEPNANSAIASQGLIGESTDMDMFVFTASAGHIELTVRGARYGSNLDIKATLFNAKGHTIQTYNPENLLSATIDITAPAGDYYLMIDGVGKGDPKTDGYSDYGSIGSYTISGTLPTIEIQIPPINGVSGDKTDRPAELTRRSRPAIAMVKANNRRTWESHTSFAALRSAVMPSLEALRSQTRQQSLLAYLEEADQALGWNWR